MVELGALGFRQRLPPRLDIVQIFDNQEKLCPVSLIDFVKVVDLDPIAEELVVLAPGGPVSLPAAGRCSEC